MHKHRRTQFSKYIQLVNKLNWSQIFRQVHNKIMKKRKINANKNLAHSAFMNSPTNVCYTRQVGYMICDFPPSISIIGLQDFRITVNGNKININWHRANLEWKKLSHTYILVWHIIPCFQSQKIMYSFLFWQLNGKFYMYHTRTCTCAYKILNLLCQKILNIVYKTDLGEIYLCFFFCTPLIKKKIERPCLTSNCISLDYTIKNVLSWISFEVLNQLSLRCCCVLLFSTR